MDLARLAARPSARRVLTIAATLALTVVPATARAGIFAATEIDGAAGLGMPPGTGVGIGALGALGYRIGLGPIFLRPEATAGYTSFSGGTVPVHVARVLGGFDISFGTMFEPSVFGHVGAGWRTATQTGAALDAGLSMSFRIVPLFVFGAQAAYNVVIVEAQSSATRWISLGIHAGIEL